MILNRHKWHLLTMGVIASVAWICLMSSSSEDEGAELASSSSAGVSGAQAVADRKLVLGPGAMPAAMPAHARTRARIFALDRDGRLRIDYSLKTALDVLLSTASLNPAKEEVERMLASIREDLPEPEAAKATALLGKYIELRRAEAELGEQYQQADSGQHREYLKKLSTLRKSYFGAEAAEALFGKEEKQAEFALALSGIENDPALSVAERTKKIKALQESMPSQARSGPESGSQDPIAQMNEKVAALRAEGGSAIQIRQLQEQYLSAEAVRSMNEMASQSADWEQRYRYFSEKKKNVLSSTLTDTDKQARIEALFHEQYSEAEIPAAKAYDRQMSSRVKNGA